MIRRPPRSTPKPSSAASDVYKRQVDNGPQAMTQEGNDWIYSFDGLESLYRALRPKGVLSVWSTDPNPAFTKRLLKTGFKVEEVKVRARGGKKGGGHYVVWVAKRS